MYIFNGAKSQEDKKGFMWAPDFTHAKCVCS